MRERTKEACEGEISLVVAALEQQYKLPEAPVDWFSYDNFRKSLRTLDFTSTPGLPYMREAPTIGKWLKASPDGSFDEFQVQRLWYDVNQLYNGHWEHVFRCFVKDEPHKIAKIQLGRYRLIMCCSLSVQMLWRMALQHQNDYLNDNPYTTPSAHGLIFCYGGWRRFLAHAGSKALKYSRDISSWDVNAPGWILEAVKQFRKRGGGPDDWLRIVDQLYRDAFEESVIRFSNGVVLRQTYYGTMKSGLFVTISDNSLAMVGMHVLASVRCGQSLGSVWATGDDVLQSYMSDAYLDALEELGCVVKEYSASLDFMGTKFTPEPVPMYTAKHIVNVLTNDTDEEERIDSYLRLYAYSPWFDFWYTYAKQNGLATRSRAYYQFWYSSPLARILPSLW